MKRLIKFLLGLAAGATVAALVTPKSGREMREQLLAGVSGRLLPPPPEPQTLLQEPTRAAAPVATAEPEAVEPGPELVSESVAEPAPWLRPAPEPAVEEPVVEAPAVEEPAVEEPVAEEPPVEEPPPAVSAPSVEAPAVDDAGVGVWPEEQETVVSEPEEPAWNAGVAAAVETPLYSEPAAEEAVEAPPTEVEDLKPRIEATRAAVESEIAEPFAPVEEPVAESEVTQEITPVAEAPVAEEEVAAEPVVEEQVGPEVASWEEPPAPEAAAPVAEEPAPWEEPRPAEAPVTEAVVPPPLAPSPFAGTTPAEAYVAPPAYEAPEEPAVEEAPPLVEEAASAWEAYEEPAPEPAAAAWASDTSGLVADIAQVPPAAEAPVVEEPVAAEPAVEEPVAAEPAVEEPVAEQPAVEEPVVEQPVAEQPAVAEPPAEATVAEAPVTEAPVAEEPPAADEPAEAHPIDQAEMRRRIEETRARLKAKAFDAMMSGEAALLSRDSGEKPVPEGTVQLDGEAAAQVDEGLSPDDS